MKGFVHSVKILSLIVVLLSPTLVFAGTVKLPQTGQTNCYDASGTVITCAGTGQDGELQTGVALPNPRFTVEGDQTVTDNLTGLIWAKDGNVMKTRDPGFDDDPTAGDGAVTWQHALDYIKKLNQENYLGYNDWRLPNRKELESLVNAGQLNQANWLNSQGYSNVQADSYWSSSTYALGTSNAWFVFMYNGAVGYTSKSSRNPYVWPVRSGQSGSSGSSIISLPRTGQTTCYDTSGSTITCTGTGQDGELQVGASWPSPRFTDRGDQTVRDNLMGLNWTKDGNAPGPSACSSGSSKTWQGALDYVKCLNTNNYLGHNDWRLPNRKELESLVNAGQARTSTWLNSQGYSNVQADSYWSSSTNAYSTSHAWIITMEFGEVYDSDKSGSGYVWPVRSGQSGSFVSWGNDRIAALFSDYGSDSGIWNHNTSSWTRLTDWQPTQMIAYGTTGIMSSFNNYGSGNGLYRYDGSSWSRLTDWIPSDMVSYSNGNIAGKFSNYGSSGNGVWRYNGSWTRLTDWQPDSMATLGADILVGKFSNYGSGNGVYKHNGSSWSQLTDWVPDSISSWGSRLTAVFSSYGSRGNGLWINDGSWKRATDWTPTKVLSWKNDTLLAGIFGNYSSGNGLYSYNGSSWTKLTDWVPADMTKLGTDNLIAVFKDYGTGGNGIWNYNGSSWARISDWIPETVSSSGDYITAVFTNYGSSGNGVWKYNGSWSRLTDWIPKEPQP